MRKQRAKITANQRSKFGPQTPEGKAKSLANLTPMKPGETLNPNGRPSVGLSIKEWWNVMQAWDLEKTRKIAANPKTPNNQAMAARALIDARSDERNSSGMPIAGADLDRIIEHTDGKARQSVDMKMDAKVEEKSAIQSAAKAILGNPEAMAAAQKLCELIGDDAIATDR